MKNQDVMTDTLPLRLDTIPVLLDREMLIRDLRIQKQERLRGQLLDLVDKAEKVADPKALVLPLRVELQDGDAVLLNDSPVTSRVMHVNLAESAAAFAVAVTVGLELDNWSKSWEDMLFRYWADQICEAVLQLAADYTEGVIKSRFQLENISWMTPGSLDDWPLTEQKRLFALFGEKISEIGLELTELCVMKPLKSLSGIVFPTAETFFNCQICAETRCQKRRAAFDPHLLKTKYNLSEGCRS